jgi:hypothetical protein
MWDHIPFALLMLLLLRCASDFFFENTDGHWIHTPDLDIDWCIDG